MNHDEARLKLEQIIEGRVPTLADAPGYDDLPHTLRPTLHAHLDWLAQFGPEFASRWLKLLGNDLEAAATEAAVRELLPGEAQLDALQPGADPPDLECSVDSQGLAIECTALRMDTATRRTGLEPTPAGSSYYAPLNRAIANKIQDKARTALDVPHLVVIGTFHFTAAGASLDELHLQNLITGKDSAFEHRDRNGETTPARQTISAVLILGLSAIGADGNCVGVGVVNPNAHHSFQPSWLPAYRFLQASVL